MQSVIIKKTIDNVQRTWKNGMEKGGDDGGMKPYSKDDLLKILPKHFKHFFKNYKSVRAEKRCT